MAAAFEAVSVLAANAEAVRRLLEACDRGASADEIAEPIESDPGLAIAVLRAVNDDGLGVASASEAVEALGRERIRAIAEKTDAYDPFAPDAPAWTWSREKFRRHSVTVRHAADRVAIAARIRQAGDLALAALLHDIGRLVMTAIYPDYMTLEQAGGSPESRAQRERRELGVDHALVGAVLVRRWAVPVKLAAAIEHHHSAAGRDLATAVRLADLVAHHAAGDQVAPSGILELAAALHIEAEPARQLLYDFPLAGGARRRAASPSPLSPREADALRGLAEGKVYKEIAAGLGLSESTVRSHIHNMYKKIGAADRAQAVLIATERGWI